MSITIYTASAVVTMDPSNPVAEAVAVEDGRILAVGNRAEVNHVVGQRRHTVDETLADRMIWPGLIDQHLHPILGASTLATEVIATEDWVLPDRRVAPLALHPVRVRLGPEADVRSGDGLRHSGIDPTTPR